MAKDIRYINGGMKMNNGVIRRIFTGVFAVFFIFIFSGGTSHSSSKKVTTKSSEQVTTKSYEISREAAEYVGSYRCKDCHWREHDTWKHTLHSKFMQNSGEYTVLGDFERNNKITVKVSDQSPEIAGKEMTTTMFKKDGKYYINTIGPDWEFHNYEVSYVIGVNRRQNYLTLFPNGAIYVLPVEWDVEQTKWIDDYGLNNNYPGSGNYWSDDSRIWQYKCGGCHSTGMKINYDKASHSFNTTFASLGIGCESCHGPGSSHIKAARFNYDREKETIVNPAKLPWRLRADICGQCHNWGSQHSQGYPTQGRVS